MAPGFDYWNVTNVETGTRGISTQAISPFYGTGVVSSIIYHISDKKIETKKERIKRIATERMFASWKSYNQTTEKTIEIKQICKPRHRINYISGRFR